jgi:hypothetical protein
MAKALGMNPAKLGKIANHKQEPWKAPLPDFIEACYRKRFEKTGTENECISHQREAACAGGSRRV